MSRDVLKSLLPPILVGMARRLRRPPPVRFGGEFPSWDAAQAQTTGYDAQAITERLLDATRRVVAGEAIYERDSVLFDHIEYSWPALASLLLVAQQRGSLRVVDFGGSLGSSWRQNRRYLQRLRAPLAWHVVEQEHIVALGAREFSDQTLRFFRSIPEAAAEGVDVMLFASSLCYVEDPWRHLREARETPANFLIVDRLPTIAGARDRISVQYVGAPIYEASYPIRCFGRDSLPELFSGWRLIESWDCDLQPDSHSRCQGFFLERL